MLALRAIAKAYRDLQVLRGVTLEVAVGEAVLLVGRNGAGKTTLLRIATGFLDPDAGEVVVDGISMASHRAAAQARLGYLPELAPAPGELTVRDHLWLRARLKGLASEAARTAIDRSLGLLDIADQAGRRIDTLSKGLRQRVGLADVLLGDPPLLVLDEPTSGMDPVQTRQLSEHLRVLARDRAVVVSSHAVTDLEALADRIVVLRAGEIVADGSRARLCADTRTSRLEEAVLAYLGEEPSA